ncbi:hypothetical protein G9464_20890 [Halostella sp. JP-L12]|uniref:hypothetical protein n=1 Tax=Halostella TaxID=1843185 RepID=UPI000EF83285|nr:MULTISPECIES: hypothetical protein [Halostella]NHN50029.1 hypothetical protein [Halostella sp. JP-L12]
MSTQSDQSPKRTELDELRSELRRRHDHVEDDSQLWWEISLFLEQTATHHDGSVRTLVKQSLAELQKDPKHKMYPHRGVDTPEEAFPDACEGCPNYGVQCPVLTRKPVTDTIERLMEQYEGDQLVSELYDVANQHECHILRQTLTEYDEGERQFLAKGQELYRRAVANTSTSEATQLDLDPETMEELDIDLSEFGLTEEDLEGDGITTTASSGVSTTPPPEQAKMVQAATEAVTSDDEDEDDSGGRY